MVASVAVLSDIHGVLPVLDALLRDGSVTLHRLSFLRAAANDVEALRAFTP